MDKMTPNQPYLLRAFFDWIIDNQLTPYMVIDANYPGVQIPTQFVNNGQIVLNISPSACVNFSIDLDWISFQARFSGKPTQVSFPCVAVSAIYAKENGAGTVFTVPEPPAELEETTRFQTVPTEQKPKVIKKADESTENTTSDLSEKPNKAKNNKPGLRIVK
jgi:stringent starvation protein B